MREAITRNYLYHLDEGVIQTWPSQESGTTATHILNLARHTCLTGYFVVLLGLSLSGHNARYWNLIMPVVSGLLLHGISIACLGIFYHLSSLSADVASLNSPSMYAVSKDLTSRDDSA